MRIGFDAKRLFNNFTGLGNHSRTTIDILTENFPEHEYYLYTPKVRLNDVTKPYMEKDGCHVVQPHGIVRGSAWRTFGLVNDMKRDGIQLFHGLSNEMPANLFHSGIPSVVTIHDVAFKTFPDMYHWHDRQIYDKKWQYACNHADRIIAISECTKQDILKYYNVPDHKVTVVYQPVAPHYYMPSPPTSPPTPKGGEATRTESLVSQLSTLNSRLSSLNSQLSTLDSRLSTLDSYMLYVGSINSRKNLLGIVKAMELMPEDLQIPLVVVGGGGSYKNEVKRYIAEHNMEHLFLWPDMVFNGELQRLYTNAQLFVYPSFYEGFGLPVVEAQLCGCPVVTSNVSSLPEAGGPFSLKADPSSPEDICNKMITALTDSAKREEMITCGREYAMKTFHPTVLANQLMDVYKRLTE